MSDITRDGANAVVNPGQDIVASLVESLKAELAQLVEDGVTTMTMDLQDVQMLDSIGIGLLIATHNSLAKGGGKLTLINPNGDILGLLKAMRLDKHFDVIA